MICATPMEGTSWPSPADEGMAASETVGILMKQQPIPEAAVLDENSVEMMRVWIAQKRLYTSLKVGMYKETSKVPEEKAWGMILADAARHVADALEKVYGADAQESLRAIRDAFARELASPSTDVEGEFVKKQ